jgi:Cof subfamily protein (haloacid dehalogenase superfamily)
VGKFDGILICTDLDGTLYKNDKTISEENKEAIEYFKREGGYFTFITGRMPYYSIDAYNAVNPNVPYGCVNGGGIYDGVEHKYVWTYPIEPSVLELVQYIDEKFDNIGIQVCGFDTTYFAKDNVFTEIFRKITNLPKNICHYRDVKESFAKIIFVVDGQDTMSAIDSALKLHSLSENFNFVRSEKSLYEILPKGVNKGLALSKLVEYLKVDINKTIAIGDFDNDVGMLKAAKLGVAVANASKAAKDAADIVTVSNEEHAIARVIYDLESGKYNFN